MNNKYEDRDEQLGSLLKSTPPPEYQGDFLKSLEHELSSIAQKTPQSKRKAWIGGSALVSAAAAVVVAALLINSVNPKSNQVPQVAQKTTSIPSTEFPHVILASEVINKAQSMFTSASSVQGRVVMTNGDMTFLITSAGDYHVKGKYYGDADYSTTTDDIINHQLTAEDEFEEAYDAKTQKWESNSRYGFLEGVGPADGGIWAATGSRVDFLRQLGLQLDTLATSNDASLTEGDLNGHKVWTVTAKINRDTALYEPDEITVSIDQDTSFPVAISERRKGAKFLDISIQDVKLNAPITDSFTIPPPTGTQPSNTQPSNTPPSNSKYTKANGVTPKGYVLPKLSFMPEGFTASTPDYLEEYVSYEETIGGENITSQTLRQGFRVVNVSTGRIPAYAKGFSEPFAIADLIQTTTLTDGMYAGVVAKIQQYGVLSLHVLSGVKNGELFMVSGNVSDNELKQIANGLTR